MNELTYKIHKIKTRKASTLVVFAAGMIGIFAALVTDSLKLLTEHYGSLFRLKSYSNQWLIFVLPLTGLLIVWFLRYFLFHNKKNKGITEIFDNTGKKSPLPAYKIPSHYINGLLTVALGGSTGIEVSTVVSTAALGSVASSKSSVLKKHKNILTFAGIAAGVTALFNAPFAGVLFALEVFRKKAGWTYFLCLVTAVSTSFLVNALIGTEPVFEFSITKWNFYALPYIILLGLLAGLNAVYLTKSVLYIKRLFASISKEFVRVIIGALMISTVIFFLPQLYGEGYFAVSGLISGAGIMNYGILITLAAVLVLKPVITAITLGAGGDGGVFAPSIFMGAFLGFLVATILNVYFNAGVIPVNFMVIGMGAMLSGSIHAPFTAIFLICAMTGDYLLFIPVAVASIISKTTASIILPYSVYSYDAYMRKQKKHG